MSVATTELSRSTQHLIDSRLDTIDRMLLGRVSRQERLEIVREVEAQIFEQLHERGDDEASREGVLAVLGRLDPPEAYLPDEDGAPGPVRLRPSSAPRGGEASGRGAGPLKAAKVGGILSLVALGLLLLGCPAALGLAILAQSQGVLLLAGGGMMALSLFSSFVAISLAGYSRMASAWAVVGLVNGILSILSGLSLTAFALLVGL